jgi:hypothetical protein
MPPQPTAVPVEAVDLYTGYLDWLAARGVGNKTFYGGARSFLARFPDPQAWARLPLEQRHPRHHCPAAAVPQFLDAARPPPTRL